MSNERGNWGTRFGFVLAAAGSAVGLGNVWKFPYVTGVNGGGLFVLVYLLCVATVGLPIMIAEILLGRATQRSPIVAFRNLSAKGSPWVLVGWLGVASGFVILSYYSVVAGWVMHYGWLALTDSFSGLAGKEVGAIFSGVVASPTINLAWHAVFMTLTIAVVMGGVRSGIERWSRILMPALFLMFVGLAVYAATLPGFGKAVHFVFGAHAGELKPAGFLEAMGQAFFTLSLGMGAMLTYGSYLRKDSDLVKAALSVAGLDTLIALLASMVIFPLIFSNEMQPQAGAGLVFMSIPIAFAKMPGGHLLGSVFFLLLLFAALTSAISLLEVLASSFIDIYGWSRRKVALITGAVTFVVGIPSALSGGDFFGRQFSGWLGKSFFDLFDYLATNWMLPAGGLLIVIYTGWMLPGGTRGEEYRRGSALASSVGCWVWMVRVLAPLAVLAVMAKSTGLLAALGVEIRAMAGRRDLGDKVSHVEVCAKGDVESRRGAGFERYALRHQPLPELDLARVNTATERFGRRLAAPLIIAPMSGGVEPGRELTRTLARTAQRYGIGLGLGSQRIALERPTQAAGFAVRDLAPDILLFANLGAVNLGLGLDAEDCLRAVQMVGADALLLHLNPIQEAVQGGDTCFAGLAERIAAVCARLAAEGIPVVVREVSFGMPGRTAAGLVARGAAGIDTGGRGGTSWAAVEGAVSGDPVRRRAGEVFRDWGLSTCQALEEIAAAGLACAVIASGGIRSGVDLAKAVALGADLGGVALPFLRAHVEGRQAATDLLAEQLIFELRLAMFGCGAGDLAALRRDRIRREQR